jgi:UDP-glucuronate decarboxylase
MHLETRVLVTGGAGFLGSHLCDRLLNSGAGVLCVDNYFTGARRNIDHLLDHRGFEPMRHDVTFPLYVEVDQIFNLACPASPIHYQHDPVQTTKTSVHGAINMLGLAKRLRAKILQASTSEVYGDPQVHPQTEDYCGHVNPIGLPQDDPRQRRPDISKANDVLGWAPHTALRDGLMRTIAYFEELLRDDAVRPLIVHDAPSAGA